MENEENEGEMGRGTEEEKERPLESELRSNRHGEVSGDLEGLLELKRRVDNE